jgi:hypothetical protein
MPFLLLVMLRALLCGMLCQPRHPFGGGAGHSSSNRCCQQLTCCLHVHRQGLETLYAAGGRKFLVWELIAADVIPIFNHVNKLVNDVNAILDAAHAAAGQKLPAEQQLLPPDQFCAYVAAFVVRSAFQAERCRREK